MEELGDRGIVVHAGTHGGVATARICGRTVVVAALRGGPLTVGDRVVVVGRRGAAPVVEVGRRRRRRPRTPGYRTSWMPETRRVTFRS